MKEKITKNRKYILMVLGILILALFNIGMRYLATRPRYKTLPEVRLVNQKEESTNGFAVMVQNGDGYEEYTSEDGKWPSEEEGYEFKEAKCMDNNGSLVQNAVTFANGKVTLKTNKTIYCTLYFDEKPKELLEITNVAVDNSVGGQVTLTVTTKGGTGKYNYSVEMSCTICGSPSSCGGNITYSENTIIINGLSYCNTHTFNIKVADDDGNTADYNVSGVSVKNAGVHGVACCAE